MKKVLMFLILIGFFGCNSEEENLCAYYDTSMDFSVLNAQGEDLLDPNNPNSFDISKIKLFYEVNGEVKEQKLDSNVKGVFKNWTVNKYQISIPLNVYDLNKKTITYIQWNEKYRDTLQSTFDVDHCYTRVDHIWLNDKLILDNPYDKKVYTITK